MDWIVFAYACGFGLSSAAIAMGVSLIWYEPLRRDLERVQRRLRAMEEAAEAREANDRRYEVERGPHR
jgi:hypothetical protein